MKKLFRVTAWDASAFTADNVANKTHWFIKGSDTALQLLDIGEYSFTYLNANCVILSTTNYGTFKLYHPTSTVLTTTDYIFYVNSETKELFGCCSYPTVEDSQGKPGSNKPTYMFGAFYYNAGTTYMYGGYLGLKFKDGAIIGTSSDKMIYTFKDNNQPSIPMITVGVILPNRTKCESTPIQATSIRYQRAPIYRNFYSDSNTSSTPPQWNSEYFESIYLCSRYFIGSCKTADNKKFMYNGYMFEVDNAMDIGTIDTTV